MQPTQGPFLPAPLAPRSHPRTQSSPKRADTPGASGLLTGHSPPNPTLPELQCNQGVGLHIPTPRSPSSSPPRIAPMHTPVLISAGVSLSRTSFPILPGESLHLHTLGSRHLHKVRSPLPSLPFPAPRLGSVSVLQSCTVSPARVPFLPDDLTTVPVPGTTSLEPRQPHLSPSAEDGGASARPQQRPQIQRLSSKPTAASAGLL